MRTALLALAFLMSQQKDPDQARVTIKAVDASLQKILDKVTKDTGIPIEWSEEARKKVDADKAVISIDLQDMVVSGALKLLLLPQGLGAAVVEKKKILIVVP